MSLLGVTNVLSASNPQDVFGDVTSVEELRQLYRLLSRDVHPDLNSNSADSNKAFARLTELYESAVRLFELGHYTSAPGRATLTVNGRKVEVIKRFNSCTVNDLYLVDIDKTHSGFLSVVKSPKLNSYGKHEYEILQKFVSASNLWLSNIPIPLDSFMHTHAGYQRHAQLLLVPPGYVTLATVMQSYPQGLNAKDMAWIYRRLLDVVGFAHSNEIIHGNITPSNILIGLGDVHEVRLINWQGAVSPGQKIPFMDSSYREFYPPEVTAKEKASYATDLYSLSVCMIKLLGENLHQERAIKAFLLSCTFESPRSRPQDSWKLRQEFTDLIEKMWVKREYRPLVLR